FFTDPPTSQLYTLSLHDALPILTPGSTGNASRRRVRRLAEMLIFLSMRMALIRANRRSPRGAHLKNSKSPGSKNRFHQMTSKDRSEEHTSELQSLAYLVCRLLLE